MTADAKIGLLVGLVFIGVIAFLINGLPNLIGREAGPRNIDTLQAPAGDSMVIEYEALRAVNGDSRTQVDPPLREAPRPTGEKVIPLPGQPVPPVVPIQETASAAGDPPASTARALTYIIKPGDSLAAIAKKVYGDMVGNKVEIVNRLFEVNKAVLKSPDDIMVGQEIVVPPAEQLFQKAAPAPESPAGAVVDNPDPSLFERIVSPFTARKDVDTHVEQAAPAPSKPAVSKAERLYTVLENDSLWDIAQKHLGSGARYHDILKLNRDRIKNENDIREGMQLKLPPK